MLRVFFIFIFLLSQFVLAQSNIIVDESLLRSNTKKNPTAPPTKQPAKTITKIQSKKTPITTTKTKPTSNVTTKKITPATKKIVPIAKPQTPTPAPSTAPVLEKKPIPVAQPEIKNEKLKLDNTKTNEIPPLTEEELKEPVSSKSNIPMEPKLELENETTDKDSSNSMSANASADKTRFKNRKAFTVDYNTWYEILKIKDKTTSTYGDSKSHYFGVGFYYDYTVYEEKLGYAFSLGAIFGNAQAGTVNTGEYYERRIPWLGYRAGGRVFFRANNRIDIGPALLIQYKETKWPEETNFQVMPQANPQYFIYIDTRWRISYPLELIQSFGIHTRQQALVWRLGINYTLN